MMLRIEGVEFAYDEMKSVLQDISFSVVEGEVFSILGPNGSGKTTLLKCINHLLKPRAGRILLDDVDVGSMSRREIGRRIGFLPQLHVSTFPFSVLDVAVMGRAPHLGLTSTPAEGDFEIAESNLEKLGISHLARKPYTRISGGERQLALIAMVLTQQPELLLLDEPTSHLDFGNQIRILEIIRDLSREGFSIIFTTHFPDHAFQLSCKVALIKGGCLLDTGNATDVITEENLKKIYGVDVNIVHIEGAGSQVCVPIM